VLESVRRPAFRKYLFHKVRSSHLVRAPDRQPWSKKTYNNPVSVIRRAFEFGYRDHPELPNPAVGLRTICLKRQDRPKIDPFNISTLTLRTEYGSRVNQAKPTCKPAGA